MAGSPDLWSRWGQWRKFDARGMKGGEALIAELNRIVYETGIASPISSRRGQDARLHYLDSEAGRDELRAQGVSDRALRSWYAGKSRPSKANLQRLDAAYWTRRRTNMIRSGSLKRRLNNEGRGRQVEIYPVDQSTAAPGRARDNITERSITVRYVWDDMVDAWAAQDADTMDEIWDDIIQDLDSSYAAYAYVASVAVGA
ncbi:hypothetical protein ACFC4G_39000 [Streptomyces sp. NPDC056002]|uniref:hypothetical protein n=1 Tax=Streptomyces sp. NPDC056002 TaxID=3345675 RepID=UPI0035D7DEB8